MTPLAWAFAVGWAVTLAIASVHVIVAWRRHQRDLRLLRHMAQGQADLQRELHRTDAALVVANAVLDENRKALEERGRMVAEARADQASVRASREVH